MTDKPRVLHVGDDRDFSSMLQQALAEAVEFVPVPDLHEAAAQLKAQRFDLIVLDIATGESGLALLAAMDNMTPVLMLAASEPNTEVKEKVTACLVKSRQSETRIIEKILDMVSAEGKQDHARSS